MGTKKKKKSKKKKTGIKKFFILEILCLIILVPVCLLYISVDKVQNRDIEKGSLTVNDFQDNNIKNYRNILLFGVDSRANELTKNTRSDSMIIASINKRTKDVKLISVFRDSYLSIDNHGFTKMTHAYAYGGPELAISTINKNLDLNITDFVTVNFSALSNVIDALGGITLTIKKEELKYVNSYARDVAKINGTAYTPIPSAGEQVVTGNQATGYCRVRYTAGGDFTRAERQRTVIAQIIKKAKSSPAKIIKVVNEMLPQIYTSLSTTEIMTLMPGLPFYDIAETTGFPFDKKPKMAGKMSVVVPTTLESNVIQLHQHLFGTVDYVPSGTVKEISTQIINKVGR